VGEECDDGNTSNTDFCLSSGSSAATRCKVARCGDGFKSPDEACDEGANNGLPGHTCSTTCRTIRCGNGFVEQGEECDDGNTSDTDDRGSHQNAPAPGKNARCGDGHVNSTGITDEDCDDGANNGTAGSTCSITCHTVHCGNGLLEQGEECDDATNNGAG